LVGHQRGKLYNRVLVVDQADCFYFQIAGVVYEQKISLSGTYAMAQLPLDSFDCPLMRVSLFNSILVEPVLYWTQSDGDKSIVS
jgi:hypothetical protein